MHKNLLLLLSAIFFCVPALACKAPSEEGFAFEDATYVRAHRVYYPGEGIIKVEDAVTLWMENEGTRCFFVETTHNNAHLCWLLGEAAKVAQNLYSFADANCQVTLSVSNRRLTMKVSDPNERGSNSCHPAETDLYVCGHNTEIGTGTFLRKRRK